MSDELDDEARASSWRRACPGITDQEIDILEGLPESHGSETGPVRMLAALRAGWQVAHRPDPELTPFSRAIWDAQWRQGFATIHNGFHGRGPRAGKARIDMIHNFEAMAAEAYRDAATFAGMAAGLAHLSATLDATDAELIARYLDPTMLGR